MPDKHYAFVDRICPVCGGEGLYITNGNDWVECQRCKTIGTVVSYEEVPDIRLLFHPTPFSESLRATRESRQVSMRTLALHIGVTPSRLREIERGFGDAPTPEEEKKIREWIEGNGNAE